MLSGSDRGLLHYFFIIEDAQSCKIVFHFLKRTQHRLPISINRFAVRRLCLLRHGMALSGVKNVLAGIGTDRPKPRWALDKRGEHAAFESSRTTQSDERIV